MLSYFSSVFNYLFSKENSNEDDDSKEDFLAEQLLELEIEQDEIKDEIPEKNVEIPRNAACFHKTGLVTYIGDNYILIDGMLYFDMSACSENFNINDKILYLGYKDANDSIIVARILENQGRYWGDDDEEEIDFDVIEHILVGEVAKREERFVFIDNSDLKFSLDLVQGTFIPIAGDWIEMRCTIQQDENKLSDIAMKQVLEVKSFNPLRTKVKKAVITEWSGSHGTCDRQIYFDNNCFLNGLEPHIGAKVLVEAIESNQGTCAWRALKIAGTGNNSFNKPNESIPDEESVSLQMEKEKKIEMTYPIKFENVSFNKTESTLLIITNKSDQVYVLNKWIMLSKKRDSQVSIKPFFTQFVKLNPGQSVNITITCQPKFLGKAKECLILLFRGFQLKRFIEIDINDCNTYTSSNGMTGNNGIAEYQKIEKMKNIRRNKHHNFIPGVRPTKPPAFISVRLGMYPIPEKIWSSILGDSEQTIYGNEYDKILTRIETSLPCLSQELNINNYIDKWHTLVYMEEVQGNISMRMYDMPKVFLIRCQEFIGIEINGLAEKRPSIIKGDRVIVKDIWDTSKSPYEGYVHAIKGDLVLMKFNPQFHETYGGSDVSIEFHFSRTIYRRAHQAINLAIANLGPDLLFPSRVQLKEHQVPTEKVKTIEWFNKKLNTCQKSAIINILYGECRPMPYIIFGPPGTGKTVTVIETILQILILLPESRILVATPSNSASNLITERLIQYKDSFTGSIIRLIANYLLDSDNIPDQIKPFCATLDIAREETAKSKHVVKNGMNLHCQKSFIGRHRVTIGTCYCLGALAQLGLPRGHFTHVIIDEAGQATEPEIMIPITFTDKENGQIIMAGDPMQLGPVVMSKYCKEFGMDESYLCRILGTFPYQKDYESFHNGFDNRLVTKLNDNYRSVREILNLPSEMFYNGSLIAKIYENSPWIRKCIDATSDVYDSSDLKTGGIFVYGIRGTNLRAEDSPSWYNLEEASMVALTTCKLYKKDINVDDIGIITPYIAQIKYLRLLFESMGLFQPKIGTVEEFQGQERRIILISTVRSSESYLHEDQKHTLGFVNDPKRLNVAITRGQVSVIVFCNPHLLSTDPLWNKVIAYAVANDKYMGCDLPRDYLNTPVNTE